MTLPRLFAGLLVALCAVVASFVPARARTEITPATMEIRRIQAHFDSVLTELATGDVRELTVEQQLARGRIVETLRAYRDRGVFPHNYDFPGHAVPYFVDRETGTLCAVAHLLATTGRSDIVDRVAEANNNVWVPELAGDTAFAAWLRTNGLTLAEAARIQVPYVQPVSKAEMRWNVAAILGTPLAFSGAAVASVWNGIGNRDGRRTKLNAVGMVSGLAAVGFGAGILAMNNDGSSMVPGTIGSISAATGAVSVALSTRAIKRHRAFIAAEREAARQRQVSLVPVVPTAGASRAGLILNVSF
jgi:hypothetical protein